MKQYFVYILTNQRKTFYIGVTNDLIKRVWQHKNKLADSFTKKYNIDRLIYFEQTGDVNSAIAREKQLKRWRRAWKEDLINEKNPAWRDLHFDLL